MKDKRYLLVWWKPPSPVNEYRAALYFLRRHALEHRCELLAKGVSIHLIRVLKIDWTW